MLVLARRSGFSPSDASSVPCSARTTPPNPSFDKRAITRVLAQGNLLLLS